MRSPFSTSCSDACQAAINSASESVRAACKDADIKTSQALDSVYVSVALMQPACEYPGGGDITPPPCFFEYAELPMKSPFTGDEDGYIYNLLSAHSTNETRAAALGALDWSTVPPVSRCQLFGITMEQESGAGTCPPESVITECLTEALEYTIHTYDTATACDVDGYMTRLQGIIEDVAAAAGSLASDFGDFGGFGGMPPMNFKFPPSSSPGLPGGYGGWGGLPPMPWDSLPPIYPDNGAPIPDDIEMPCGLEGVTMEQLTEVTMSGDVDALIALLGGEDAYNAFMECQASSLTPPDAASGRRKLANAPPALGGGGGYTSTEIPPKFDAPPGMSVSVEQSGFGSIAMSATDLLTMVRGVTANTTYLTKPLSERDMEDTLPACLRGVVIDSLAYNTALERLTSVVDDTCATVESSCASSDRCKYTTDVDGAGEVSDCSCDCSVFEATTHISEADANNIATINALRDSLAQQLGVQSHQVIIDVTQTSVGGKVAVEIEVVTDLGSVEDAVQRISGGSASTGTESAGGGANAMGGNQGGFNADALTGVLDQLNIDGDVDTDSLYKMSASDTPDEPSLNPKKDEGFFSTTAGIVAAVAVAVACMALVVAMIAMLKGRRRSGPPEQYAGASVPTFLEQQQQYAINPMTDNSDNFGYV